MKKGKRTREKYRIIEWYGVLLFLAILIISIAYAQIAGQQMTVEADVAADAQDGVFIADVVSQDTTNGKINYYQGTLLSSEVTLESSTSSVTYEITLYNNSNQDYVYIGDLIHDNTYSNENIGYIINGLTKHVTTIVSKASLPFTITFAYNTGASTSNNTLESIINFRFKELPILELSNDGTTYTLENIYAGHTQEYEFTVSNYNKTTNNTVPMKYSFETGVTEGSPIEVKIYNESGQEVTGEIEIGGEGQEDHVYTAKIIWDESKSDAEYEGQEYTCNITLKAKPTDEKYLEYIITKGFNVEITTCSHKNDAHNYVDGICTLCGDKEATLPTVQAGEKATETSTYSDGTNTAVIPAGFTVSGVSTEYTINEGLVVYLIDDKTEEEIQAIDWTDGTIVATLQQTYDQFVWIPMAQDNINDMYMCQSETGSKTCNITVQEVDGEDVAYCTTHSSSLMAGRLYATSTGENYNANLTTQKYTSGSGLREPDVVTGSSDGTGTNGDGNTKYLDQLNGILGTSYASASDLMIDLQDEYNEIVKSVYQNQGFYIGRYETSGMTNSDTNSTVKVVAGSDNSTNANISRVTWYRMYAQQKKYAENKELNSSVGSTMIQGAAYDQVMKFIDPETSFVTKTGRVSHDLSAVYQTGGLNYAGTVTYNDVAKNIYDLEGNVRAWTTEAYKTDERVLMGGYCNVICSPSYRFSDLPIGIYTYYGSVCQLYLQGNLKITTTEPTECSAYKDGVCTICGKTCSHNYGEWETVTEATCAKDGTQTRTCTICKNTETQTIAATGEHNFISGELPEGAGTKFTTIAEYSDGTNTAVIPAGFTVSGRAAGTCTKCGATNAENETIINEGLVIYLIDDKTEAEIEEIDWTDETTVANLQKNYDQFVWIPIPKENINDMYMCQSEDGTKSCKITVQEVEGEEVAYCTTHSSTAMAGRLYATDIGENFNASLTTQTYTSGSGLREPDIVTGLNDEFGTECDTSTIYLNQLNEILGTSYSAASSFKADLQSEYNQIVKSVYKNEGFYIGRYETSNITTTNGTAVKVVAGTTSGINSINWYYMYAQQKDYSINKGIKASVGSAMIQGAAYDQVMNFIDPSTSFVTTTGTIEYNDVSKNIYHLESSEDIWTTEAGYSWARIIRGGGGSSSLSYRINYAPFTDNTCSVCLLYIEHTCIYENGVCPVCGATCTHTYENGVCTICGEQCTHTYENGVCTICGERCTHTYENGVCTVCGKECTHTYENGVCTVCGKECTHTYENGTCTTCGTAQGELMTFYIMGDECSAPKDWTWEQFVGSEYDTGEYGELTVDGSVRLDGSILKRSAVQVCMGSAVIVEGSDYRTDYGYGT